MEQQILEWVVEYGNDQNIGARSQQQDYFALTNPKALALPEGFLAIIADGMGGHAGGGNASVIAVTTFIEEYKRKTDAESIPSALQRSLLKANEAVVNANEALGEESEMGTTLVACVLQAQKLFWVSVGDSCLFLYRNGRLQKINKEHSYGAELDSKLKAGQITQAEVNAETKKRNMLTSYLGIERIPQTDLPEMPIDLRIGEKVLLCTDGLVNAMTPPEIEFVLQEEAKSAQEKCEYLTQQALKKQLPKQDNLTTILLELNPTPQKPVEEEPHKETLAVKMTMLIIALLLLLTALTGAYLKRDWIKERLGFASTPTATPVPKVTQAQKKTPVDKTPTPKPTVTLAPSQEQSTPTPSPTATSVPTPESTSEPIAEIPTTFEGWLAKDPDIIIKIQVVLGMLKDLNGNILYRGIIDNDPGKSTQSALKAFQEGFKNKGLEPTGFLDEKTFQALEPHFSQYKTQIDLSVGQFRQTHPYPTPTQAPEQGEGTTTIE